MRRRDFIKVIANSAATSLSWPFATRAQQSSLPVIGFLDNGYSKRIPQLMPAFLRGLAENGFVESRNVIIEYRTAEGDDRVYPAMAEDLVRRGVAVMVTVGGVSATMAAKAATNSIPIAFLVAIDPVASGIVASLNHPGGHLTGVTTLNVEVAPKRLEVLHELLPQAKTFALLVNPTNTANTSTTVRDLQVAAQKTGLALRVLQASSEGEIDRALAALDADRSDGLVIGTDGFLISRSEQLAKLTLRYRMPSIFQYRTFAMAGGLISYGSNFPDTYYQLGLYTGRLLKGEKPADLPVQQSTKVELIINLKTARALGITVPLSLLGRADEVIE
jgi:putative tryptophan/tyrosine transport system substrate-binding protein